MHTHASMLGGRYSHLQLWSNVAKTNYNISILLCEVHIFYVPSANSCLLVPRRQAFEMQCSSSLAIAYQLTPHPWATPTDDPYAPYTCKKKRVVAPYAHRSLVPSIPIGSRPERVLKKHFCSIFSFASLTPSKEERRGGTYAAAGYSSNVAVRPRKPRPALVFVFRIAAYLQEL